MRCLSLTLEYETFTDYIGESIQVLNTIQAKICNSALWQQLE